MALSQRLQVSVVLMEQEEVGGLQSHWGVPKGSGVLVGLAAAIATTPIVLVET